MTAPRIERHQRLSDQLGNHSDNELTKLLDNARSVSVGVGGSAAVLDVDGVPVFVKRIPLSERELAHPASTANLFDLPLHCHYGIGGPSVNTWRELAANKVVTNAILAGETESFPMLYHWRVLPGRPPIAAEHADIDKAVAAQGGSRAVRTRLEALAAAPSSLLLFSEYIPHAAANMLRDNPVDKAATIEHRLAEIVTFLRDHQLLHMDAHWGNIRTDGERLYLTDFGLATSPHFDLSPDERDFVEPHHPRRRLRRHAPGQLAGDRSLRDPHAHHGRPGSPQRIRNPLRRRSYPVRRPARGGRHPVPPRPCRRNHERFPLEAVRR
ncbi:serine/threonine protein phosphatase [Nocardia sp. CA-145437]|uniref:serine/threonine protein phosphatase n=1 Tax=Nocardia sp. CA-145437 TaxID=3239980 RepID=UPI003D959925